MIEPHLLVYAGVLVVFIIGAMVLALCVVIFRFIERRRVRNSQSEGDSHDRAIEETATPGSTGTAFALHIGPAKVAQAGHVPIEIRNLKIPPVPPVPQVLFPLHAHYRRSDNHGKRHQETQAAALRTFAGQTDAHLGSCNASPGCQHESPAHGAAIDARLSSAPSGDGRFSQDRPSHTTSPAHSSLS